MQAADASSPAALPPLPVGSHPQGHAVVPARRVNIPWLPALHARLLAAVYRSLLCEWTGWMEAFLPFLSAVLSPPLLPQSCGVYGTLLSQVFGDSFIHGGRPGSGPVYVDPQVLLSNPTVDPYVPLR
jgi:hypothetical protein